MANNIDTKSENKKGLLIAQKNKQVVAPVPPVLNVLIMNVDGPNDGKGTADRRKETIHDVIERINPNLVLFQEFSWATIAGKTWSKYPIPDKYQLTGSSEASLLYDTNELLIQEYSVRIMQSILDELKRKDGSVPTDFTPLPRMCARIVETKGAPKMKLLCVSWHGRYSGYTESKLVEEFKNIMKFFKQIFTKENIPVMIGGDFNIKLSKVKTYVESPFKIYEYTPTKRRSKNLIDFYILTENHVLEKIHPIDLSDLSKAEKPLAVLDHDPVQALLS